MSEITKGLSRRSFLTLGGVAALGGAAALAGCAPQASSESKSESAKGDDAAMKTADQTKECDIAVVGAGGAGMWAAVEAVRAGKSVVVIEKGANVGVANGSLAGGPFTVGSKLQQEAGIDFTVEEAFKHIMEYGHWSTNAAAIKAAVEISGETIDQFTSDFGVPTGLRPDNYGAGHASVRANFQSDPKDSKTQTKGEARMKPLQEFVESEGGEFLFNTAGKRLIMENGACVGVQCEGEGVIDVKAKQVIVATGGFLGSADMMLEKFGTFVNPLGNILSVGEGIDMVQAAGGQVSTQWGIAGNEFAGSNQKADGLYDRKNAAFTVGIYGTLLVNNQGRRFSNEGKFANLPLALGGAISLVGGKYYAVVDQTYVDGLNAGTDAWTLCGSDAENWRTGMMTLKGKALENVQANFDAAVDAGWAFKADSIEALTEAIDAPDLTKTVEAYNAACAAGKDDQFYKPACFLQPVAAGPFYAMQYEPSAWVTIGGIRTNDRLQAIDAEGAAIPGLYVAGADNGTLMSAPYTDYEGYSLMCAYCGGRLAGQYAAAAIDA
ncbi:FAD-dependent oxidoreductase [Paraeggerthella hongkongensis]|uniref:FAD-binding dehydrogenase n=1 Tax=Paraeggerthella hongkongensis TaxID=230658 RepID=A0A3N0AX76_9ACTN|nr:FAD-dependent oxidoreductase [Paraeggerthella hongkongensis]RNL39473.1 FAD-binding dehydrogenase [Paraeggerthella hongkongensis]